MLEMYADGQCTDWRFSYPSSAPSIKALSAYLQSFVGKRKATEGPLLLHSQPTVSVRPLHRAAWLQHPCAALLDLEALSQATLHGVTYAALLEERTF